MISLPLLTTPELSIPMLMVYGESSARMAAPSSHLVDELSLELKGHHSITPAPGPIESGFSGSTVSSTSLYSVMFFSSSLSVSSFLPGHHTPAPPTIQK